MQKILIYTVHAYRYLLSPFFGTQCRFHPSCSRYAIEALERHGSVKGLWLTGRRLLRCNPWCRGGIDPVPPETPPETRARDRIRHG